MFAIIISTCVSQQTSNQQPPCLAHTSTGGQGTGRNSWENVSSDQYNISLLVANKITPVYKHVCPVDSAAGPTLEVSISSGKKMPKLDIIPASLSVSLDPLHLLWVHQGCGNSCHALVERQRIYS